MVKQYTLYSHSWKTAPRMFVSLHPFTFIAPIPAEALYLPAVNLEQSSSGGGFGFFQITPLSHASNIALSCSPSQYPFNYGGYSGFCSKLLNIKRLSNYLVNHTVPF